MCQDASASSAAFCCSNWNVNARPQAKPICGLQPNHCWALLFSNTTINGSACRAGKKFNLALIPVACSGMETISRIDTPAADEILNIPCSLKMMVFANQLTASSIYTKSRTYRSPQNRLMVFPSRRRVKNVGTAPNASFNSRPGLYRLATCNEIPLIPYKLLNKARSFSQLNLPTP